MRKIIQISALAIILVFGIAINASATPVYEVIFGEIDPILYGNENDTNSINKIITESYECCELEEIYKMNVGGPEEKTFASSYETSFDNDPLDPQDALIYYTGGPIIDGSYDPIYLLVKDGNQEPNWFVYDISDWDGEMDISITGFWPKEGAISHVSLFSCEGNVVPEPGTLLLMGSGLAGLGLLIRRKKK